MKKLFLDANIFFAATCSGSGASNVLFRLAKKKKISLLSNRYAFKEALINVEKKLGGNMIPDLLNLVSLLDDLADETLNKDSQKYLDLINMKDLPILASAIHLNVDFLITLDKKGFKTERLRQADLPFQIMEPGEFLQSL